MNTAKTWLKKAIVFLVVAAMAITLFPFTGLKMVTKAAAGDVPAHSKTRVANNDDGDGYGDGTYKLELSVTGDASTTELKAKANILVIYDTSSSMTRYRANGSSGSSASGPLRADSAERAVYDFADALFSLPNAEVEMALVTYDHTARTVQGWTTTKSDITGKLSSTGNYNSHRLEYNSGTNYQAGVLQGATLIEALDNRTPKDADPTVVIFITDGLPSQMNGDGPNTYYNEPGEHAQVLERAQAAMGPARTMETREGTDFYGIYAYGDGRDYLDDVVYYAQTGTHRNPEDTSIVTTGITDYYFNATNTAGLEAAIQKIFHNIVETLGVGEVSITDGTTSNVQIESTSGEATSVGLLDVDKNSFEYWLSIPVSGNSFTRKDPVTAETRTYTLTDNEDGTYTVTRTGAEPITVTGSVSLGQFKFKWDRATELSNGKQPPEATFDENTGKVIWNLSYEKVGTLLTGVTYSVSFDVFPSQYTYDLVAELDNAENKEAAYNALDPAIKEYLHYDTKTGAFSLDTNKGGEDAPTLTWTDTRTDDGPQTRTYTNPDPVRTQASEINLEKTWIGKYGAEQDAAEITLQLVRVGDSDFSENIVLTKNGKKHEGKHFIAIGLLTVDKEKGTLHLYDPGHDYMLKETGNVSYHWELTADIMHPMLVNGEVVMMKEVTDGSGPEGMADGVYKLSGGEEYYGFGGKIYMATGGADESISAVNTRRANLNIVKAVNGEDAPSDAEFTFNVTIDNLEDELWFSLAKDEDGKELVFDDGYVQGTGLKKEIVTVDSNNPKVSQFNYDQETGLITYRWEESDSLTTYKVESVEGTVYTCFTGFYHIPNKSTFTIILRDGWNMRATNVLTGTAFTIVEDREEMPEHFAFEDAKVTAIDEDTKKEIEVPEDDWDVVVEENTVTGTVTIGNATITSTFTNDYDLENIEIKKEWVDNNDQDGIRPSAEEFEQYLVLKADDTVVTDTYADNLLIIDNEDNTYTVKWTGLPKYGSNEALIKYTVEETEITGYATTGSPAKDHGTITNTHEPEETEASVKKVWDDANNQDGKRPTSLSVTLSNGTTVTLNEANGWTAKVEHLPKYANGQEINYTWTEGTVPTGYTLTGNSKVGTLTTLTNSYTPEKTSATVKKVWVDGENQDGIRPPELKVTLSNGEEVTLNAGNNWEATVSGLPKYANGQEINYTWTEGTVPTGYTLTGDSKVGNITTLTNTHTPDVVTVQATKEWVDKNNINNTRPASITFQLKNGDTVVKEVTLDGIADTPPTGTDPAGYESAAWVATFINLPKNAAGTEISYTVDETEVTGYTKSVVKNSDGSFTITNTYNYGALEISKIVDPGNGNAELSAAKEFTFTINLTKGDAPLEGTYSYTITGGDGDPTTGTIANGGTVNLKGGQTVHIADLPIGTSYVVTEEEADGYKTTKTGDTGTIQSSTTAQAVFTNTYEAQPVKVSIPVIKKVIPEGSSITEIEGMFTFTIAAVTEGAPVPKPATVTSGGDGVAAYFSEITFTNPGTYTYTITESFTDPDAEDVGGITIAPGSETRTVTVIIEDDGEGKLQIKENKGTTFENPYSAKAVDIIIPVEKILKLNGWTGPEDIEGKFKFTLDPDNDKNAEGVESPLPTKQNWLTNPAPSGGTAKFGDPETTGTITVKKPGVYHYTITETLTDTAAPVPGVSLVSEPQAIIVTVVDDKEGNLVPTVSGDGTSITNTYIVEPDKAHIPVKKVLTGENAPDFKDEFTFILTPLTDEQGVIAPMPVNQETGEPLESMTVQSNGNNEVVWFDEITYSAPGQYQYEVKEESEPENPIPGVTYDKTVQTVTVTVSDDTEGKMVIDVSSTETQPVTFTNAYDEAAISIPVEKELKLPEGEGYLGPESIEGKFRFTLTAVTEGAPMPDETEYINDGAKGGNMSFGTITYTSAGEYTYRVTESNVGEKVPGVVNDEHPSKEITVHVYEDDTGDLTAELSDPKGIKFTNTYTVSPTTAGFPVKKVISVPKEVQGPEKWSYEITVEAPDETKSTKTVTNDDPQVVFEGYEFVAPGQYTFKVTEAGDVPGVVNETDETGKPIVKTITIDVKDNRKGQLVATVPASDVDPITFTNTYTYETTAASLNVQKILSVPEGFDGPDDITGKFEFTLTPLADEQGVIAPMPEGKTELKVTNGSSGSTVSFEEIPFVTPGTFTYQIVESKGDVPGVTNDQSVQTAAVEIVDGRDGSLKVKSIVYNKDPKATAAVFTNVYSATPVKVTIPVKKILVQEDPNLTTIDITGMYTFTLSAADGTPLPKERSKTNPDANGGVVIFGTQDDADPITFTKPDVYTFTVTEKLTPGKPNEHHIENDSEAETGKTVTVKVKDNKKGALEVESISVSEENPLTFTNTRQEVSATVVKAWDDFDDLYKKRPESLEVDLFANKEKERTVTLSKDNNWTVTVTDLPKFDKDGKEIAYTWAEGKMPAGYELTNTETEGRVTTLTNSRRYGDLVIRKDLTKYNDFINSHDDAVKDQVTFIFHITAKKGDTTVYEDYAGLTFNGEEMINSVEIKGMIPVGAVVTVVEDYSGAGYAVQGQSTKTVTITDPTDAEAEVAEADLTNTYDDKIPGGYGIVNHYTKDAGKWAGERVPAPVPETQD